MTTSSCSKISYIHFSFEGSYRYELMEEYYPELFDKMKEYIKQGRWNVCGSSFENGDVNIPSPEALFRNILFGNSYFDKNSGKEALIYICRTALASAGHCRASQVTPI